MFPRCCCSGIPDSKDEVGSDTWHDEGIIQTATRHLRERYGNELYIVTDVCFCEYTSHGHCGVIADDGELLNDPTLRNLQKQVVSHAEAGGGHGGSERHDRRHDRRDSRRVG